MKNNQKRKLLRYFSLILFLMFFLNTIKGAPDAFLRKTTLREEESALDVNDEEKNDVDWISGAYDLTGTPIFIDNATPYESGSIKWSDALEEDWCHGLGTKEDPFIIENVTIDGLDIGSCIKIKDSSVFFIIRNCTIYNSETGLVCKDAGIKLENVNNSQILNNNCSFNNYGINVLDSCNNSISNNVVNSNEKTGITIGGLSLENNITKNEIKNNNQGGVYIGGECFRIQLACNFINNSLTTPGVQDSGNWTLLYNNTISHTAQDGYSKMSGGNVTLLKNNISHNEGDGININNVDNNTIQENLITHNSECGIKLSDSHNNSIINNSITYNNNYAIQFYGSIGGDDNYISQNQLENSETGISIEGDDNRIVDNFFSDNTNTHAFISSGSVNNLFCKNNFTKIIWNPPVDDFGTNTKWNSSEIGNFWEHYTGEDKNDDGIGDAPFWNDDLPIYKDGNNGSKIIIDENSPNMTRHWDWIETRSWCEGSGSKQDPYIIHLKNPIDARFDGNPMMIANSSKYFILKKSKGINSGNSPSEGGLILKNVKRGTIQECNFSGNNDGISISSKCVNLTINLNYIFNNSNYGIHANEGMNESIIANNIIMNSTNTGIFAYKIHNTTISDNYITNNSGTGLYIQRGNDNIISNNRFINNSFYGIYLQETRRNEVCKNDIQRNQEGITLKESNRTKIFSNLIRSNRDLGVLMDNYIKGCHFNKIYNNTFEQNKLNAIDEMMSSDNKWNSSFIGNNWDNYSIFCRDILGREPQDRNDDGIGDDPYVFNTAIDYLPIWSDRFNGTAFYINGSEKGINAHNWTWASSRTWCSGKGTKESPYIIRDCIIDAENKSNCIEISNSDVHFELINCSLINATYTSYSAGLKLINVSNAIIKNGNFSINNLHGILLQNCNNVLIHNNTISYNDGNAILSIGCMNCSFISDHIMYNKHNGSYLIDSHDLHFQHNFICNNSKSGISSLNLSSTTFDQNNISHNDMHGVHLILCKDDNILNNNLTGNGKDVYGRYAVYLQKTNHTKIQFNKIKNGNAGIYILSNREPGFNTVFNNTIINTYRQGLKISECHNNNCTNNFITDNGFFGIDLYRAEKNNIRNNTIKKISSNAVGIYISYAHKNQIIDNTINLCKIGIDLGNSDENLILRNYITEIEDYGIILFRSDFSNITQNYFNRNLYYAVYLYELEASKSEENLVYNNTFIRNKFHAIDLATNTKWNNSKIGNFWDNYTGTDPDHNGIGNEYYIIPGSGGLQDKLPIVKMQIYSPENKSYFSTAPLINVSVIDNLLGDIWYNVSGSSDKVFLTDGIAENMQEGLWNSLSEGNFNISFNANNTHGDLISNSKFCLYKDTINPKLNVSNPDNQTYWNANFKLNVTVQEVNLDSIWYRVAGNDTDIFIQNEDNNTLLDFNSFIWNKLPQGKFQVQFFANDSAGNVNDSIWLVLYKDALNPKVLINKPLEGTSFSSAPKINITFIDPNFENAWYKISGNNTRIYFTDKNHTEFLLDEHMWNKLGEGDFTLSIFAIDSLGNLNNTFVLTLTKDIPQPPPAEIQHHWILNPFIIDDIGTGDYTWKQAANEDWCKGSGTYAVPYIIENISIKADNEHYYCILIRNSEAYFIIRNCNFSSEDILITSQLLISSNLQNNISGIFLDDIKNGKLVNNNCSNNEFGIYLLSSTNNSISGNIIHNNYYGIYLVNSPGNIIENNQYSNNEKDTADDNDDQKEQNFFEMILNNWWIILLIGLTIVGLSGFLTYRNRKKASETKQEDASQNLKIRAHEKRKKLTEHSKEPKERKSKQKIIEEKSKGYKVKKAEKGKGEIQEKMVYSSKDLKELRKTESEMEVEKIKHICIVHKGEIHGAMYLCPVCDTYYCMKCAKALKEKNERCWSCDTEIQL